MRRLETQRAWLLFIRNRSLLSVIEIGRGCPYTCDFCQTPFLRGACMRHRSLEHVLEHIEHLVRTGLKDIRFITPDSLAYLSDDGVHPDCARLEQALVAMHEVAGKARICGSNDTSDV